MADAVQKGQKRGFADLTVQGVFIMRTLEAVVPRVVLKSL